MFWFLAKHYALRSDLKIYTGTERTTDWLLINGDVDALFRVRALAMRRSSTSSAASAARSCQFRRPRRSAATSGFDEGVIPQVSYNGRPNTERDEPTISVKELLVASEDVPAEVIAKITSVLFEHGNDMLSRPR